MTNSVNICINSKNKMCKYLTENENMTNIALYNNLNLAMSSLASQSSHYMLVNL